MLGGNGRKEVPFAGRLKKHFTEHVMYMTSWSGSSVMGELLTSLRVSNLP